jgi:hypothetical protein
VSYLQRTACRDFYSAISTGNCLQPPIEGRLRSAGPPQINSNFGVTGHASLTLRQDDQDTATEMTPVKAAFLSLAMLAAIAVCGVGIYAADASTGHAVVDGYGVTAPTR